MFEFVDEMLSVAFQKGALVFQRNQKAFIPFNLSVTPFVLSVIDEYISRIYKGGGAYVPKI